MKKLYCLFENEGVQEAAMIALGIAVVAALTLLA